MAATRPELLTLRWGRFTLEILPQAGGSVAGFRLCGATLFRSCSAAAKRGLESLDLAGFPMVPFASRIAGNCFRFQRQRIALIPNLPGQAQVIHGHGWRSPWTVDRVTASGCRMSFEYSPVDWPWRYRVEQTISLQRRGFRLELALTNLSDVEMPGGLGWHPYLHRGDAHLTLRTLGRIRGAGDPEGERRIPHQGFAAVAVDQINADHGFYGWDGKAEIRWPRRNLGMTVTAEPPLSHVVLWTPPRRDYFCVEPVSHLPDAANWHDHQPNGWHVIRPRATLRGLIEITVAD